MRCAADKKMADEGKMKEAEEMKADEKMKAELDSLFSSSSSLPPSLHASQAPSVAAAPKPPPSYLMKKADPRCAA